MKKNQYEEFNALLNGQIVNCSNFLQSVSRVMNKPLVLASRATINTEAGAVLGVGPEDVAQPDLTGITIAVPCSAEVAEELMQAFEEIMRRHSNKN